MIRGRDGSSLHGLGAAAAFILLAIGTGCAESKVVAAGAQSGEIPPVEPLEIAAVTELPPAVVSLPPGELERLRASAASMLLAADSAVFPEGWPRGPAPEPGAILPHKRIVAYYGNPLSKRMGILGEIPPEEMLAQLDEEVEAWTRADPSRPAVPALHLVTVVAQAEAGRDGMYRARVSDELIERVMSWAETRDALVFLDVQAGKSTLQKELPSLVPFLRLPNVHLGVDPEFMMKSGHRPGTRIGTMDADDINYAIDLLADLVEEHDLPPKVLVVHRFTRSMVTNADEIDLDPRVQVVIHMDGWGPPHLKRDSYEHFVVRDPVQFTGFKIFFKNDTKSGSRLMQPEDLLQLTPQPVYIQYQ